MVPHAGQQDCGCVRYICRAKKQYYGIADTKRKERRQEKPEKQHNKYECARVQIHEQRREVRCEKTDARQRTARQLIVHLLQRMLKASLKRVRSFRFQVCFFIGSIA